MALWEIRSTQLCQHYADFVGELHLTVDHPGSCPNAGRRLQNLCQGCRPVYEYTQKFRTLAVESGWNNMALRVAYYQGLLEEIKDELASREEIDDLEELVAIALQIDQRMKVQH